MGKASSLVDRSDRRLRAATGYVTLFAFLTQMIVLLFHEIPKENRELILVFSGIIEGAFLNNLLSYYFGGTPGNHPHQPAQPESSENTPPPTLTN